MARRLCLLLALPLILIAGPALAHDDSPDEPEGNDPEWHEDSAEPQPGPEVRTPRRERSVAGDLTRKWFHVGGGIGGIGPGLAEEGAPTYGAGRFVLGTGGYTWFLYGGTELAVTSSRIEPIRVEGAGYLGIAVPVPVLHPLIGIRGSIGGHVTGEKFLPQLSLGPQAGFILRAFDGKPGLRLMVDGGANIRPMEQEIVPEVFVTLAGVF